VTSWDPKQYERFAVERARAFHDLVARIPTRDAVAVVDLGCGTGSATATLVERWPSAAILGIDSSAEMIEAASKHATAQLRFRLGDLAEWRPDPGSVDVIVANASLQWVPDHETLLARWAPALDRGGTLAFQVPERIVPAAEAIAAVAASYPQLASVLKSVGPRASSPVLDTERYIELLSDAGLVVDAWQTTYFHILPGDDAVYEWFTGTGIRPYLDALADDPETLARFRHDLAERLRADFPRREFGTVLPFPRLFVVATHP
jgi:trans-aconitate 2-methyltransferase